MNNKRQTFLWKKRKELPMKFLSQGNGQICFCSVYQYRILPFGFAYNKISLKTLQPKKKLYNHPW